MPPTTSALGLKKKHGRSNIPNVLKIDPEVLVICVFFAGCCLDAAKVSGGSPFIQRKTFGSFGHTKPIAKTFKPIRTTAK